MEPVTLHALWRPGAGLAVWLASDADSPETIELPEPLAGMLPRRRFRREIGLVGPGGRREFVTAATLGTSSAIPFLDSTRSLGSRTVRIGGDIDWYRHLLDGARRFVGSRAVAPGIATVGGEPLFRWQAVPSASWRSWLAVMTGAAPESVTVNGGNSAIGDLIAEIIDHECRARIGTDVDDDLFGPLAALLADPGDPLPVTPTRVADAQTAWTHWNSSAPGDESSLIFRLHEPGGNDDRYVPLPEEDTEDPGAGLWRLEVCRRAADGQVETVIPHRLDTHELDQVTTDLAAAVRVFDDLARAQPDPSSLDFLLTTDQAEQLFSSGAAALADHGFPVLLPRTIAEVRPTLGVLARPVVGSQARESVLGLGAVREFEWQLALGDEGMTLTDADLDELARQKGDLVRIRGVWVRAEGAALTRAAAFVVAQRAEAAAGNPADVGTLFDLIAGDAERVPVPVTDVSGLAWLDDIAAHGAITPIPLPPIILAGNALRPYQQRGVEWLAQLSTHGIGAVLADDMGLGKTVQIIALLVHEQSTAPDDAPAPTLIVCPMSVVGNWEREIARFAPELSVTVHHGPGRGGGGDFAAIHARSDVVITTFAVATRDRDLLRGARWRRIVVDEAQHVKNVNTAAAKSLRLIKAPHRVALTGTPVENRLEDLRAVIDLVNPGLLGSPSVFRARFAEPIERERDPVALRRLTALTRPFILRREKTDPAIITDLPDKTELTVRANLTVEQAALYRAILDELMIALKDKQQRALRRRTVLAALTRLKQVCNHPAHYLADGSPFLRRGEHRSGKTELLADILTTLVAEGDRALVFTQFAAFGELLAQWLTDALDTPVPLLHGGLPRTERDRLVAGYQADDGPPILLATLKAGGTGLNLTAANQVVHVDRWWNPAVEDQATDRAYRIGQRQRVTVSRFVCVGTLEERIDEMITKKRELSRLTVATGESWLGDLADDDLFDLFTLRDEAVSE